MGKALAELISGGSIAAQAFHHTGSTHGGNSVDDREPVFRTEMAVARRHRDRLWPASSWISLIDAPAIASHEQNVRPV